VRVRLVYDERHLRPGGTPSGPSMFGLGDVSLYIGILAQIGPVALAVTANVSASISCAGRRRAISSANAG
jgi:acyl-coenzyme A thioesterase PaaI-like protein